MAKRKTQEARDKLVAQGRNLVEGRYNYSVWEYRIFVSMIQSIREADKEFKPTRLYLSDLIADFGTKSKDDYKKIKTAAITLCSKLYYFRYEDKETGELRKFYSSLFRATVPERLDDGHDKYIELCFNDNEEGYLKDMLIDLRSKGNFLLFDKRNIANLQSRYSQRLYPLLKSYENQTFFDIEVEKLREMLLVDMYGRPTDQYKKYFLFKKYVILKPQQELKDKTDIYFTFKEIKKGRAVHIIRFYVHANRKKKEIEQAQLPGKTETREGVLPGQKELFEINEQSEVLKALIKADIDPKKAQSMIDDLGEDVVALELKHAQKELKSATNVRSVTGFLISKIEAKSYTNKQAILQADREQKKRKKQAQKQQQELHKGNIEKLRAEYTKLRHEAVKEMTKNLDKEQLKMAIDVYAEKNPFIKRAMERAEQNGNKKEAQEFRDNLLANGLQDETLQSFDKYLEVVHQYKLGRDAEGEQVLQTVK